MNGVLNVCDDLKSLLRYFCLCKKKLFTMILLLGLRNFSSKFSHSSYIKELLPAILNDYTPYVFITHGRLLKSLITFRNFIFRFFFLISQEVIK